MPVDGDNAVAILIHAVDSDDVETVLQMRSPADIAEAWWRSYRSGRRGEADDSDWWAVVFVIGLKLVEVANMREIWRLRKDEFAIAALTAIVVVVVGV